MSKQSLSDVSSGVNIEGVAPGTYVCNGTTYYGDNIATVTSQAIAEQSQPLAEADWYACECGRTVDEGKACPECIAEFDKPGQSACLINGHLDWLPTDAEMEAYFARQAIESDTIDIDDFMLAGLPETSYQPVGEAAEYGLAAGIDY